MITIDHTETQYMPSVKGILNISNKYAIFREKKKTVLN